MRESLVKGLVSIEEIFAYRISLSSEAPADFVELEWSAQSQAWVRGRIVFIGRYDIDAIPMGAHEVSELANAFRINPSRGETEKPRRSNEIKK